MLCARGNKAGRIRERGMYKRSQELCGVGNGSRCGTGEGGV